MWLHNIPCNTKGTHGDELLALLEADVTSLVGHCVYTGLEPGAMHGIITMASECYDNLSFLSFF